MPALFPASYSTLSPSALAALIETAYGFTSVRCTLLVRGVGDTYSIETPGSRYILRVYRSSHRSLTQVAAELELLLDLQAAGVPVSYPLRDDEGALVQVLDAIEGPRYGVLFTYAAGQSVSIPNASQLRNLGREVARFHNISSGYENDGRRWTYDLDTTLFQPLERLEPYFSEYPEGIAWLRRAAEAVRERLERMDTSGFSTGYCHFDLLPKNFHFEGDAVTLFDFDFLGYGWLVNDMMTFWQHLNVEVYLGRLTQTAADEAYKIFLDGYREYRPLGTEELKAMPYLMLGFWVFYMGFHTTHDQFLPFLQTSSLRLRTGALRKMMEMYTDLTL